jgi:hypothetical protein
MAYSSAITVEDIKIKKKGGNHEIIRFNKFASKPLRTPNYYTTSSPNGWDILTERRKRTEYDVFVGYPIATVYFVHSQSVYRMSIVEPITRR